MNILQACQVIYAQRPQDSLLVATMGAMFAFDMLDQTAAAEQPGRARAPGRLSSVPLMGGASGLGLGLALAQPDRQVIVVDGDASLMMELGSLITLGAIKPANLLHVVIHNGTQFSGLANLQTVDTGVSLAQLAVPAGYRAAQRIDDAQVWAERFAHWLAQPGPNLVELRVDPPPARVTDGFEPAEMPDLQFSRMGAEARALQIHLGTV